MNYKVLCGPRPACLRPLIWTIRELVELSPISHCSLVLEYRKRIAFKINLFRLSNTNTDFKTKQKKNIDLSCAAAVFTLLTFPDL
jgi:hypothetical protein